MTYDQLNKAYKLLDKIQNEISTKMYLSCTSKISISTTYMVVRLQPVYFKKPIIFDLGVNKKQVSCFV